MCHRVSSMIGSGGDDAPVTPISSGLVLFRQLYEWQQYDGWARSVHCRLLAIMRSAIREATCLIARLWDNERGDREVENPLPPILVARLARLPWRIYSHLAPSKPAYILCLHPKAVRPFGIFRNAACSRTKLALRPHGWHGSR
jgi:hypothetical protein